MRTRRPRGAALPVALLVTAATVMLASGCAVSAGAASPPQVEKPNLTVAVVPALDSAGFFIALYGGLFRDQGLNVNFIPATSSETAIADQAKGVYDITGGNYVSYIQAQQNWNTGQRPSASDPNLLAADLNIFAEGSVMEPGAQGIYTMPGSSIKTVGQLTGHTVAINAPNNILYLLAASVLAQHGISPSRVHFVTKYPFPQMPAELQNGTINAAVMPEPFASDAEESLGAVPLIDLNEGATTNFPVEGYVVTKKWALKYPKTLKAFYTALEQGQQVADSNRAAVEQAMEDLPMKPIPLGVPKDTAAVMALDNYPVSTGPVGAVDRARLERVVNVMQQFLSFPAFNINSILMHGA